MWLSCLTHHIFWMSRNDRSHRSHERFRYLQHANVTPEDHFTKNRIETPEVVFLPDVGPASPNTKMVSPTVRIMVTVICILELQELSLTGTYIPQSMDILLSSRQNSNM